jgi:hypothetical protein
MSILVIDGVKYEAWTPTNEDEFERMGKEHAKDIFGEQSIYLDIKHKLRTKSGIGSIPDGYVIVFGEQRHWHIVEVELSSHPLYEHIVPQVGRFIGGIRNPSTQKDIADALFNEIDSDEFDSLQLKKAIGTAETYKFLADLVSRPPVVTIIIEKRTEQLDEAISALAHSQIKVVEFQTFTREGIGLNVHAHLFEPLYSKVASPSTSPQPPQPSHLSQQSKRVGLQDLINAGLLNPGQKLSKVYKNTRYEALVTPAGKIKLLHDHTEWDSLSGASDHITRTSTDGWEWWRTLLKDGQECLMDDLREKLPSDK